MSSSGIPPPAPYRRPDGTAYTLAQPQQPSQYDANNQLQQEQTQAMQGMGLGATDPELLLRQRLAPELQQWNQQQMAPPPVPSQSVQQQQFPEQLPSGSQQEPQYAQSPLSEEQTPRGSTTRSAAKKGRGGARTTTTRRRRGAAKEESDDGDLSEEFSMEGVKTKSGRKVHRPAHFNPAQKTPSRRRGPYRRNYDARICKICQRGHSPQSNMIVFCDSCNTPYHQLCHDPPIDDLVIAVAEAEWFCTNCSKLKQEKPLQVGLSGENLTEEEKRLYLANLPKSSLVELIFYCESQHPTLPLYDPQTNQIVADLKNGGGSQLKEQSVDGTPVLNGESGVETERQDTRNIAGAPNWEDMIVRAVSNISGGAGAQPKAIFEWIGNNFPAFEGSDIRAEAQSSLQSALQKNRLTREGHIYRINAENQTTKPATPAVVETIGLTAPGFGIKLPPETGDEDGMLVDDDPIAFSHRFNHSATQGEDVMDGIVHSTSNGDLNRITERPSMVTAS